MLVRNDLRHVTQCGNAGLDDSVCLASVAVRISPIIKDHLFWWCVVFPLLLRGRALGLHGASSRVTMVIEAIAPEGLRRGASARTA